MAEAGAQPTAGWYQDPAEPARLRYWDGADWTTHVSDQLPTATTSEPERLRATTAQRAQPSCVLHVTAAHSPLAFFYEAFEPTIEINGVRYKQPWGSYSFPVAPGHYVVSVSYPWVIPECGKATLSLDLASGEQRNVVYTARLIRFVPGKMREQRVPLRA